MLASISNAIVFNSIPWRRLQHILLPPSLTHTQARSLPLTHQVGALLSQLYVHNRHRIHRCWDRCMCLLCGTLRAQKAPSGDESRGHPRRLLMSIYAQGRRTNNSNQACFGRETFSSSIDTLCEAHQTPHVVPRCRHPSCGGVDSAQTDGREIMTVSSNVLAPLPKDSDRASASLDLWRCCFRTKYRPTARESKRRATL